MPIKVIELEKSGCINSVRGKILEFLKKDPSLAFTLKEIYDSFLKEDKLKMNFYNDNPKNLYKLIYNYLREFSLKKIVIHKGNYYYFNKEEVDSAKN